jgi:hypothetical protein
MQEVLLLLAAAVWVVLVGDWDMLEILLVVVMVEMVVVVIAV